MGLTIALVFTKSRCSHSVLTGSPNGFVFSNLQPGSIINSGKLTVNSGSNLNLLGGTVASTGELAGGNITVATVPGENLLRIEPIWDLVPNFQV